MIFCNTECESLIENAPNKHWCKKYSIVLLHSCKNVLRCKACKREDSKW